MSDERTRTYKRLTEVYKKAKKLPTKDVSYVVISDTHLGDGGPADDFRDNKETLANALCWYRKKGFEVILLGDIEELWQFDLDKIVSQYRASIYSELRLFGRGRVHRVFGNHDIEWRHPSDPAIPGTKTSNRVPEGLKLSTAFDEASLFLAHGHQGTTYSDKYSGLGRFVVRNVWTRVEPLARTFSIHENPSEPQSRITKDFEAIRYQWAKNEKIILICGHSHRAIFASKSRAEELVEKIEDLELRLQSSKCAQEKRDLRRKLTKVRKMHEDEKDKGRDIDPMEDNPKPCYFNTGCALYTGGITVIEIDKDVLRLIKWHRRHYREQRREILKEGNIGRFLSEIQDCQTK